MSKSRLVPPPIPADDRIEHAATVMARLGEVDALEGWKATFHRDNLECTGVWPAEGYDLDLADIEVEVEKWYADQADLSASYERHRERCRLAIRHGIECGDLELRLMREALDGEKAAV